MKKFLKILLISVLLFIFIVIIGIHTIFFVLDLESEKTIPEESLVINTGRNVISYKYQDKVEVIIRYSDRDDSLCLRTCLGEEYWGYDKIGILYGTFEKVSWYDDNLFILMDKKYYSFDIDGYEVPPLDEDGNPQKPDYELKEYSESEFKTLYPYYESFDWYGH